MNAAPHRTQVHFHKWTWLGLEIAHAACSCGWEGPMRTASGNSFALRREVIRDELGHIARSDAWTRAAMQRRSAA